jgi:hypothetical protein
MGAPALAAPQPGDRPRGGFGFTAFAVVARRLPGAARHSIRGVWLYLATEVTEAGIAASFSLLMTAGLMR